MAWSRKLSAYFSSTVRERGRRYYRAGAVRIWSGADNQIDAKVLGGRPYRVQLQWQGFAVRATCTCPHFERSFCKHVWATILAAEAEGRLGALAHVPRLSLAADDSDFDTGGTAGVDPFFDGAPDDAIDDEDDFDDPDAFEEDDDEDDPRGETFAPRPAAPLWRTQLAELSAAVATDSARARDRQLGYFLCPHRSFGPSLLAVEVACRIRKQSGDWGVFRRGARFDTSWLPSDDAAILALMSGSQSYTAYSYRRSGSLNSSFQARAESLSVLLPMMTATGRCYLDSGDKKNPLPIIWDDGPSWTIRIVGREAPSGDSVIEGVLERPAADQSGAGERMPLDRPWLVTAEVVGYDDRAARIAPGAGPDAGAGSPSAWLRLLTRSPITVPDADRPAFLTALTTLGPLPPLDLGPSLELETGTIDTVRLSVEPPGGLSSAGKDRIRAALEFDYGPTRVARADTDATYRRNGRVFLRDAASETRAAERLTTAGFNRFGMEWWVPAADFAAAVPALAAEGWVVEADGRPLRSPSGTRSEVRSGIDWFELHAAADYDGIEAPLPALLAALEAGSGTIRLDDGSLGLLPAEWLAAYRGAAALGRTENGHVRFHRSQAALLDVLLEAEPSPAFDTAFADLRRKIRGFAGIRPANPPKSFAGKLRGYQREGLGWLRFLREFGFGGCLADDMGLGKTVQVLALVAARRRRDRPILVVVPRSLVFNWKDEAARFAPRLAVLDYTGTGRAEHRDRLGQFDLVLTTYGTLRRDAAVLKDVRFDTLILDEAQAIKNAATAAAKATRLVRADHRLALTGTPVENHLGELWSLFDVLNPGMLGTVGAFREAMAGGSEADLDTLARALAPFILRRTKAEVIRELPPKIEQTVYCELEPKQRRLYDELRRHYRGRLLDGATDQTIRRSKIQVLEALLRLRQAACHPGLIDRQRAGESSAKLDALVPQVAEVIDGGAKVLVFSQFTSLLAIVRDRFDTAGIEYEYLDGRTRNRGERVRRFQEDPDCRLFLISLKAGGLGLNLTAAEYVFILDPWWNPAVEAQAVDRTHRIGQTRQVFAYRLIARDTVEERILDLQASKRALADAIIGNRNSLVRDLGRKDLEMLLG